MRRSALLACAALAAAWAVGEPTPAVAQPVVQESALTLYYQVTGDPTPGLYDYNFKLVLDNHTGTYLPGQGFGGIVFGDTYQADSRLADFVLNPGDNPGPYTSLTSSGDDGTGTSYHNGPTFAPVFDSTFNPVIWHPSGVGDMLTWSGVSHSNLSALTFSTIFTDGLTTVAANFQPAVMVPEPGPLWLGLVASAAGLAGAAWSRRRRAGG
jgi:hypothetical protein